MGERFEPRRLNLRKRRAGSTVSLAGAFVIGAASVFIPSPAQASINPEIAAASMNGSDETQDSFVVPQVSEALVAEEDSDSDSELALLKLNIPCSAQVSIIGLQQRLMPDGSKGKPEPLAKGDFRLTVFEKVKRTFIGKALGADNTLVVFNGESAKGAAQTIDFRSPSGAFPITSSLVGGASKEVRSPCGLRQMFRSVIPYQVKGS